MTKINKNWLIGGVVGAIIVVIVVVMMLPKHLSGSYTSKMSFLGMAVGSDTMVFDGNKVTEKSNGDKGTYKIDGDKLIITFDGQDYRGNLAKDKKSFDMTVSGVTLTYKKVQ